MRSPVFQPYADQSLELARSLSDRDFLVVGLCAAWCDTCTEFFETFEAIANEHPDATFVWLDIEDDADIAGDIDVENFPTVGVFHHSRLLHFGVSLPHKSVVDRLLAALKPDSPTVAATDDINRLPALLQSNAQRQARSVA